METSEVLNRAADLIEERGWVQGDGWPGDDAITTGLCLEGGIMAALDLEYKDYYRVVTTCPAYTAVADYLDENAPFIWNDRAGRTSAEVIEVLRACALIEGAREEQDAAWETYAESVTV